MISISKKKHVKMGDYIDQFCSHRANCTYANCPLRPISEAVIKQPDDIAYIDEWHCAMYRTKEDGIAEADIVETGVWI